ncbi:sigma-54-dependent Fis family transcriptional regulator [Microvenator marinus]|uniref:Sigma-54-dependent Fis family transcriptional regulator n=2 Tax=Microvenator marinus TaxID=2600177 RepID=A0A5B8XWK0_9DELT|nr:sigma-54-dependent Fis family transcriptional regulator [Microvenator marinus]
MLDLFEIVRRAARSEAAVLIRGESGTGKEHIAKALHELSPRSNKGFNAINCATLTPELLASELFGHVKGAFTGAIRDRKGLFQTAHQGTIFLDEVAEIPLDIQARLLRVIQEQTFIPLGGTDPVSVDVRIISATHQSLREAVQQRRFRNDLMYRIRVVPIFIPRLAEREGDVEALTWYFIDEFNRQGHRQIEGIRRDAMELLLEHEWPGNVRELRNVIEYAFAIGEGPILEIGCMTPELRGEAPTPTQPFGQNHAERDQILDALARSNGRKSEAADLLGMSRSTLWRKMREHHLIT